MTLIAIEDKTTPQNPACTPGRSQNVKATIPMFTIRLNIPMVRIISGKANIVAKGLMKELTKE